MKWFSSSKTSTSQQQGSTAKPSSKHGTFDLSVVPKPGFLGSLNYEQFEVLKQFRERYGDKVKSCVDHSTASSIAFSKDEETKLFQVHPKEGGGETTTTTTTTSCSSATIVTEQFTEIDSFLLRFLRARGFDLEKASLMLDEYLKWRISFHVKEICEIVRFPWVTELRATYPHGYHGVDKIGRPIYIERIGKADIAAVLKLASLDHLLAYWVQQYEYVRRVILPSCSIAAGRRIEQGVSIIDLSGLGFSHCGSQSRHVMRQLAKLSQDYFPEMLGAMVVVNAPSVFGPVWSFAKTLIDEHTVKKITLLTSRSTHWKEYLQELAEPDQLPEFLGGTSPDNIWDTNYKGPWRDDEILKQLKQRQPSIPDQILHFDISTGDAETLKALDGVHAQPAAVNSCESDLAFDDASLTNGGKAIDEEINELTQGGVNVVE